MDYYFNPKPELRRWLSCPKRGRAEQHTQPHFAKVPSLLVYIKLKRLSEGWENKSRRRTERSTHTSDINTNPKSQSKGSRAVWLEQSEGPAAAQQKRWKHLLQLAPPSLRLPRILSVIVSDTALILPVLLCLTSVLHQHVLRLPARVTSAPHFLLWTWKLFFLSSISFQKTFRW